MAIKNTLQKEINDIPICPYFGYSVSPLFCNFCPNYCDDDLKKEQDIRYVDFSKLEKKSTFNRKSTS